MDREPGFLIKSRYGERLFKPANGSVRDAFVEKALGEPGVSLNDLNERMSAFDGVADLLQFRYGFVKQAHLAEGDSEIVMRLGIFIGRGYVLFEFLFKFAEHFREIYALLRVHRLGASTKRADGSRG